MRSASSETCPAERQWFAIIAIKTKRSIIQSQPNQHVQELENDVTTIPTLSKLLLQIMR